MSLATAFLSLNWLAVLVVWIGHVVLNLVWYLPPLFGRAWVELTGKEMKPAQQWIPAGIAAHLVCVIGLAVVVRLANAATLLAGIAAALVAWLGFVVTLEAGELVWEKIPFKLFLIRIGAQLVAFGLAGAVLAVWR
jgi:hypothetical protein